MTKAGISEKQQAEVVKYVLISEKENKKRCRSIINEIKLATER